MIINYITDQLRDLFYHPTNEFNIPTWAQSMELLVSCVIPCDYYIPEELLILSKKILNEAKTYNFVLEMYGVKNGKKILGYRKDYKKEKIMIKGWIQETIEERLYIAGKINFKCI